MKETFSLITGRARPVCKAPAALLAHNRALSRGWHILTLCVSKCTQCSVPQIDDTPMWKCYALGQKHGSFVPLYAPCPFFHTVVEIWFALIVTQSERWIPWYCSFGNDNAFGSSACWGISFAPTILHYQSGKKWQHNTCSSHVTQPHTLTNNNLTASLTVFEKKAIPTITLIFWCPRYKSLVFVSHPSLAMVQFIESPTQPLCIFL